MKNAFTPALAGSLLLAACSGGSDDEVQSFVVRSTEVATFGATPVAISGGLVAFLAAEDSTSSGGNPGTDLNGDGDVADRIAHVVNTGTRAEFGLGVAATDLAWAGAELFLVVDEAEDGQDWNGDTDETDVVLLHWSETAAVLTFVEELDPDADVPIVALDGRVLYAVPDAGVAAGDSNLRAIEAAAPLVPVPVTTRDTVGPLAARLLGEDEELVFLTFDETDAGRDLNGDGDATDTAVLALLDGSVAGAIARSTGLAVDAASPFRAKSRGAGDWYVGFLVNEAAQGGLNRNSSAVGANFRPAHCAGDDVDTSDDVLAVLIFADWDADPVQSPPRNHGLAARDRIAFADGYVAAIVDEADDSCDLNQDGNSADVVVRWMPVAETALDPLVPINLPAQIRALAAVPGGGFGLYELSERFVIVSSEAEGGDIDPNNALDADLVGWLDPSVNDDAWDFTHGSLNDQYVEASWVSARETSGRLGVAFTERVGGQSLNQGSVSNPGDTDTNDAIPTFAHFTAGRLAFPGIALALDRDAGGITFANNWAFYRLNEVEDSRDLNGDGDEADLILERTNLTSGVTYGMSVLTPSTRDAVFFARFGNRACAAFLASEAAQGASGTDFNGDGDETDVVLRWFRF